MKGPANIMYDDVCKTFLIYCPNNKYYKKVILLNEIGFHLAIIIYIKKIKRKYAVS